MTTTLETKKPTITGEELVSAISSSHLLPQVIKEIVIEKAISDVPYTEDEFKNYHQRFQQVDKNANVIPSIILRQFKIQKFKHLTWGNQVEPYFLSNKLLLDQVSFSLIQTNDGEIAQEIYFRIQEGEESFSELAKRYSQGSEAKNGGWVGTYKLGSLNPNLAKILRNLQPGEIPALTCLEKMFIIVRLEKVHPAKLTEEMREEILQQMFEEWLKSEITNYTDSVDLSKISTPDLTINNYLKVTDKKLNMNDTDTDNDELSETYIDKYTELNDEYVHQSHNKRKKIQLLTSSFICLLTGGLVGFYLSGLSKLSYANFPNIAPKAFKNDIFYDAINQATKAANLNQTAQSASEWEKVSQSWINAISLLNSLPENHPKFTLATQKIQEYERNLNYSRQNSQNQQNSFRVAVNHATKAANLTQKAASGEEWETIIKHWEKAIAFMKAVEQKNPNYFVAQQKTLEYQRNLNYAFLVIEKKYPESYAMSKI